MDTKQKGLNWWCDRAWIKFGCLLTLIMTAAILINWNAWSSELKIIAAMAALIPIHVIEEWVFPGGFHYQYNITMYHSEYPDRYPMCRLSDMFTNLSVTIFYMMLTGISLVNHEVNSGVMLATILFCGLEFFAHTIFGTVMYFKFKSKDKTTIYGPGSITAYLGFAVFGIILIYCMQGRSLQGMDYAWCAGVLGFIAVIGILIPGNLIKRKDSKYYFKSNGYFDRFLKQN